MNILVIADHDNQELKETTLNAVDASLKIGGNVDLLVAGENCDAVARAAAKISGVGKVLKADNPAYRNQLAENIAPLVVELAGEYSHILAASTTNGKNILPRVAVGLDVAQISDVTSIESSDTFKRNIYAGNAIATVKSTDSIKIISVRASSFDKADLSGDASIESIDHVFDAGLSSFIKEELGATDRIELTSARIVISGGRGMQSSEGFELLHKLADKLGGAVGASRAAVDAGYVPNDMQVGQTGKIVAPDLYVAVGISGAVQHIAGMKESKVIVAINSDKEAPIFQYADYGIVADLFDAVPEFESLV
ncbi:electron transfer flavoprotein subunit alpha/FixB family protein [Pseudomaricurvus alkylphenolicus]|uniref:electron transfer flavoprotein subunit alpha/FixB family protein n=1 Tax=Pseudomaricurvus alkylphenolicus TaxID=1306991 RepID=UPI00142300DB|nr:FAD-binding protein [Pseudomaricurvus alkylphenolicus]NIB43518.1 electron transfer flavoprotein subunit alpha/FixB family protein [Pseudomaricurvus alkylphenolicus]